MNDNLFDDEFKEQAKETVDEVVDTAKSNKRLLGEIGVFGAMILIFNRIQKKNKLKTDQASFELGKLAGRAEYAEELAEKAILSGFRNN